MQIHLILGLNGPDSVKALGERVERVYANKARKLGDRPAWLVADNVPAKIVSEKLEISTGANGVSALVTSMSDYFGRAEPDLWSWIKVQWEAQDGDSAADAA